jgi:hypothetical protein
MNRHEARRIPIVSDGTARSAAEVRRAYRRLHPLEKLKVEKRGWTLDVLNVVRSLNKPEFSLSDVYAHAADLARLHPNNAHVPTKSANNSKSSATSASSPSSAAVPMPLR